MLYRGSAILCFGTWVHAYTLLSPSPISPQLPWSEFDNQFQIMFQLGNGKSPTIPESSLSNEGHDFLSHCFEQDPCRRWRANHLLDHPFVKVCVAWSLIGCCCSVQPMLPIRVCSGLPHAVIMVEQRRSAPYLPPPLLCWFPLFLQVSNEDSSDDES